MSFTKILPDKYINFAKQINQELPGFAKAYSVVHNHAQGEVWQDACGSLLIILGKDTPFAIYNGHIRPSRIHAMVEVLAKYKYCALIIKDKVISPDIIEFIQQHKYKFINRLRFTSLSRMVVENISLPGDFEISKIDSVDKLKRCYQHNYMLDLYGSYANYLNFSCGFGLIDKTKQIIASEIHLFMSNTVVEPSVTTLSDYRNKGLSAYLSRYALKYVLDNHLTFEWGCDDDNYASIAIVKKLGLQQLDNYTMIWRDLRTLIAYKAN